MWMNVHLNSVLANLIIYICLFTDSHTDGKQVKILKIFFYFIRVKLFSTTNEQFEI